MKHYLLAAIIMALCLVPSIARAYDFSAVNDDGVTLYYEILSEEGNTCKLSYNETGVPDHDPIPIEYEGTITVPQTANGYTIVSIGRYAFGYCRNIISVNIPNTVTSIEKQAFYECYDLTSITIPNSVTTIGNESFSGCSELTSVIMPDNMVSIGEYAFNGCSKLESITMPNSMTSIGEYAFYGCEKLSSFRIPESVTTIENHTFSGCTGLNTIYIPSSITSFSEWAFEGCYNLQKVIVEDIASWCNIDFAVVVDDFVSFFTLSCIDSNPLQFGRLYSDENTEITNLIIPNTVTNISDGAFYGNESLVSVTISNSVTSIGDLAFYDCRNLKSVTIEDCIISIGENTFDGCTQLETILIPNSIENIGTNAFRGTAWYNNLPDGVVYIGKNAYRYKGAIPEGTSIVLEDGTKKICHNAFSGRRDLTSIEIPSSVTTIEQFAFSGCNGLTSVTISDGVTTIEQFAFSGCNGLTSIEIPSSVTSIGYKAFSDCKGLTSITISNGVNSIGNYAFSNCTNLSTVYSKITNFFDIDKSVFSGSENTTLYVPKGMATTYRASTGWSVIKYIEEMPDDTPDASFLLSCSNKGSVSINGSPSITSKIAAASIKENADNTFTFTPKPSCRLEQVILNGLDITANVENNTLTCIIPANSQMIVTFTTEQGDINNDGRIDISDVVSIVNKILGN